jgi:hypothetical protein
VAVKMSTWSSGQKGHVGLYAVADISEECSTFTEDGGGMFLRNADIDLQAHRALQPKRPVSKSLAHWRSSATAVLSVH